MSQKIETIELSNGQCLMPVKVENGFVLFRKIDPKTVLTDEFFICKTEETQSDRWTLPETVLPENWKQEGRKMTGKTQAMSEFEALTNGTAQLKHIIK